MAAAGKQGSMTSGHGGFHPTIAVKGNPKFLIFGVPILCQGDPYAPHTKPDNPPHSGVALATSKMMVFGKLAVKVGDATSCGGVVVSGEPKFNIE